ncbi:hypothetical protein GPN2_12055 [Streptomyces murinus]
MGTTPARAGTTYEAGGEPIGFRDHPRTRGDHIDSYTSHVTTKGPPPHARGPQFVSWGFVGGLWSVPYLRGKGHFGAS